MTDPKLALLTDQYALTMVQGYWRERMFDEAVFSLFVRRLPEQRNFLVACGLADVLDYIETLRFGPESLEYLRGREEFEPDFLDWMASFRFTGQVRAVPEGTVVLENEPPRHPMGPGLRHHPQGDRRPHDSYSGFRNNWNPEGERPATGLAGYLRERDIHTVVLCGLARDFCVKWIAEDAADAGFRSIVLWDLTRAVDPSSDDALRHDLERAGVVVTRSEALT
jgi:hypothetical protein